MTLDDVIKYCRRCEYWQEPANKHPCKPCRKNAGDNQPTNFKERR